MGLIWPHRAGARDNRSWNSSAQPAIYYLVHRRWSLEDDLMAAAVAVDFDRTPSWRDGALHSTPSNPTIIYVGPPGEMQ